MKEPESISNTRPHLLICAGVDPTGGAGLVRDIETATHFGVSTSVAVTAITAQDNHKVHDVWPLSGSWVLAQMQAALGAHPVRAIKIGMLGTTEIAVAVANLLEAYPLIPTVLDPVLKASSGGSLADQGMAATIITELLPKITLLTPNIYELATLTTGKLAKNAEEAIQQAQSLLHKGARSILIKGGHATYQEHKISDILVGLEKVEHFSLPRLPMLKRGTGCSLASAIGARWARGQETTLAITQAKAYVHQYLQRP